MEAKFITLRKVTAGFALIEVVITSALLTSALLVIAGAVNGFISTSNNTLIHSKVLSLLDVARQRIVSLQVNEPDFSISKNIFDANLTQHCAANLSCECEQFVAQQYPCLSQSEGCTRSQFSKIDGMEISCLAGKINRQLEFSIVTSPSTLLAQWPGAGIRPEVDCIKQLTKQRQHWHCQSIALLTAK